MRETILYYVLKYDGHYDKITKALKQKETVKSIPYSGSYITCLDEEYPKQLFDLKKPPYILFYKGNLDLLKMDCISVIGSRNAIQYAKDETEFLIKAMQDVCIVSGMAKGIDTKAHESAVNNKLKTIAILGSGIDYVYPYENKALYQYLCTDHLVISEYPGKIKPKPYFFPFRNRIIAALSTKLYVMQANFKSGTLLTVNDALECNRDIYVLPYRKNEKEGEGCLQLIEQGANIIL